jgi:hypothetical protein
LPQKCSAHYVSEANCPPFLSVKCSFDKDARNELQSKEITLKDDKEIISCVSVITV